jgi:hypothetical protein
MAPVRGARTPTTGAIRSPDTIGQLVITADLRAGKVTCHVDLDAPREGRPTTRVNWLVRQLKNAPDSTRVECFHAHARGSSAAELLSTVRDNPASLVTDPNRDIRTFRVAATTTLGSKRGRGRGSFVASVPAAVDTFYAEVLQAPQGMVGSAVEVAPGYPGRHRRGAGSTVQPDLDRLLLPARPQRDGPRGAAEQ